MLDSNLPKRAVDWAFGLRVFVIFLRVQLPGYQVLEVRAIVNVGKSYLEDHGT